MSKGPCKHRLDPIKYLINRCFLVTGVLMLAAAVAYGAIKASKILHEALLDNIMRCPMSFFDTTPLGRLINRFSKDVDTMDAELRMFIQVLSGTGKLFSFEAAFLIFRGYHFFLWGR